VSSPAVGAAAGGFEAHVETTDLQSIHTASLGPLTGVSATRGVTGVGELSWSTPAQRPDVLPEYVVDRTVAGVTTRITPAPSVHGTTSGFTDDLAVPARIDARPVTQVTTGNEHTCALAGGTAYCWGDGWLGNSPYKSRSSSPIEVSALPAGEVTEIGAGGQHTCAVARGDVYCWGDGQWGQLGNGWDTHVGSPTRVNGLASPVTALAVGYRFTCAVAGGEAYCWGYHYEGQLGNGTKSEASTPTLVVGLEGQTIVQVTAGSEHACARSVTGAVWCWGRGTDGKLGQYQYESLTAFRVPSLESVTDVSAGNNHTCAIAEGTPYCWGAGHYGQLGTGVPEVTRAEPTVVSGLIDVSQVEAGWDHTCAIAAGVAWCWGDGYYGALGVGDRDNRYAPVALELTASTAVSGGQSHSCAITRGALQCWGIGWSGKLGNGDTSDQDTPVAVLATPFTGSSCPSGWLVMGARCIPGPDVPVSYRASYLTRGWSSAPVDVAPSWSE